MNIGDTVYVRWYGSVVEGKLLDGEYLGMKQVQIPLDGRKPTALFTPNHIYQSAAEAMAVSPTVETPIQRIIPSTETPSGDFFYKQIQEFKDSHWDHERNHLQIDSLDEFYQLYSRVMAKNMGTTINMSDMKKEIVNKQCKACKYWEFTRTLASMDRPEWHCRDGFSPSKDCQESAAYNDRCMQQYPNQRPADWVEPAPIEYHKPTKPIEAVQLSLFD